MAVSTRTAPVRFNASGALKTVKSIWGRDKVEYYQWATRGSHYCNKVRAAALQVRDWDEAVLKLNRIIYRRVGEAGRLRVKESVNPIECGDWIHLKSWSHKGPYLAADGKREIGLPFQQLVVADLPTGFGFDQFGLLVRKECQADVDRSGQQLEGPRPRPRRRPSPLGENEPHRKRARRVGPRARLSSESQLEAQRTRGVGRRETSDEQLREEVTRSLDRLEEEFAEKERLSREQTWCEPIPLDRKVSTVRNFHKAFHDPTTLPIRTCMACYQKCAPVELETIEWDMWVRSGLGKRVRSPFACRQCFPPGQTVSACRDCAKHLRKGGLSPAGYVHMGLGCEHMYPVELEGLTVVEQKLIGLYSCYGLITKHIIPKERKREQWRQNASYPKHVKGHVTVFPNNVQELASKVLPHLLVKVMEEIHVSWQGPKEPTRSDLSALLSVRRHVVERALNWLKENNPLYADIHINTDEMDTWEGPSSDGVYVPSVIYNRMERNEPTVYEKVRTAQLVPSVERGLEEDQSKEIIEIVAELERGEGDTDGERGSEEEEDPPCGENEAEGGQGGAAGTIHEITSSGMFALDDGPDVTDGEKLRHAYQALGSQDTVGSRNAGSSTMTVSNAQSGKASEPYIVVSRGEEFADSFDARFFAKTFPTLFPWGTGGPKLAEESTDGGPAGADAVAEAGEEAQNLVASRNMSLEKWAKLVLQRHGGRFATHNIFSFLVFNMGVRSRNRRASMLSVTRKNFAEVERIVRSLTLDRLNKARAELEASRKTTDEGVQQLLRSLTLYGFRQPMSRESRLSMRRKILSLIIHHGIPAIWFTLNPNDLTNPLKLKLAAYRGCGPEEAEELLKNLYGSYNRIRLAVSDPVSSAIFFHREMSMFFEHYVRTGQDSVFGRISQYFGAVETNERGSLHLHGLLWLRGNMNLCSAIGGDGSSEEQAAYREKVVQYVDSVFTEDLDQAASEAVQKERSVWADISELLENHEQFAAAFDEEANFCAGCTQIHKHTPTCLKYANLQDGGMAGQCRFKAPWPLVEMTAFTEDGVLKIRRSHVYVNRYNKAIAVGLRHNHDFAFILTQHRTLALVYYVTNYATKVEDPVWKRAAAAAGLLDVLGQEAAQEVHREGQAEDAHQASAGNSILANRTRQFLMRVANRVFTERPLSQVEVAAHLLGYDTEYSSNEAWTFLNVSVLYWDVFRRWHHLQRAAGTDDLEPAVDEKVLLEEAGQRVSLLQAYPHRGEILRDLSLYDYMSVVQVRRKSSDATGAREVEFDSSSPLAQRWVQVLRKPGKHAIVCLHGHLSMNFDEEDEAYHGRAAVQHLALFVPWESFLSEMSGDVNDIWQRKRQTLSRRMSNYVDNIQLLRRSAEDAKRDARQWAALSGGADPSAETVEGGVADGGEVWESSYRRDNIGTAARIIDVLRNTMGKTQVTAGSKEIEKLVEKLHRFQEDVLGAPEEPCDTIFLENGESPAFGLPLQEQLRSIKAQQTSMSREREQMIQGMQSRGGQNKTTTRDAAVYSVPSAFGEQDLELMGAESERSARCSGPSMTIELGPSTSFDEAGIDLAKRHSLNRKQTIALRLICQQLDKIREDALTSQLCLFLGGEGGTGKSRVIEVVTELFENKGISHRLLLTATSGTAAARINGVTIHSACGFSKDTPKKGPNGTGDGIRCPSAGDLCVDGQVRMNWQEKYLLVVDEVSMLGARTLYAVNERLCKLRGSAKDFGGIPIVVFCGDFRQFRPVQERSILLPSTAFPWDGVESVRPNEIRQHDMAHALWKKFTTVVVLTEQVRAAGDQDLLDLLRRIRKGEQTQADLERLNKRCFQEGRVIPWDSGITVVTPLNRNRWNLNFEGVLSFQKQKKGLLRIFVSGHKWRDAEPTEEEALMMLNQGDDSAIPVPAVFMFVPGMPVVVNRNTHQGLKLINGASYTAVNVILDRAYPGHRVSADTILHFGPPAGILLTSETTRDLRFVGMRPGTILLTPISTPIPSQRKRPWQRTDVVRRGLPCSAAFACTDYKVQGKTLERVVLELRGTRTTVVGGNAIPSQCDPYSLYVQLSRCPSLDGIMLLSKAQERDFVANKVPADMAAAETMLEELSKSTVSQFGGT